MALGAALEPKQNPDGTWVFNPALSALNLRCAAPDPRIIPMHGPYQCKGCCTLIA